jgi:hypothetical protein
MSVGMMLISVELLFMLAILLAVLTMLTADSCVSPRGDLVVAAHSGLPDWGSGPKGKGKLYKIAYTDRDHPQPAREARECRRG